MVALLVDKSLFIGVMNNRSKPPSNTTGALSSALNKMSSAKLFIEIHQKLVYCVRFIPLRVICFHGERSLVAVDGRADDI